MKQGYFERMEGVDSFNDRLDDTLSEGGTSKTDAELGDLTSDILQDPKQKPFDQLTPEEKIEKGKWFLKAISYNYDQFHQAVANNPDGKSLYKNKNKFIDSYGNVLFKYKNYSVSIDDGKQSLPLGGSFYIGLRNEQTKQKYLLLIGKSGTSLIDKNNNQYKEILFNDATISEHLPLLQAYLPLLQTFTNATYFMRQEQLKLNKKSFENMKKF